ncbi:hypothetical protein RND81_09G181600 [Saponaria officinalis]
MTKSSFGSRVRKRLSDITNMHSQPKSPLKDQENVLPVLDDSSSKNYVQQLLKENAVMVKLIQEKDKIIELNGVELQKLRVTLQRMQMQNLQLAQSNSQMLAEINTAKDRLKALQHDLACKDALHKAKMLELQEKAKVQFEKNSTVNVETKPGNADVEQSEPTGDKNENKVPKTKRGRAERSQSLGATSSLHAVDKEIVENKRRCLRRQSARLKPQEVQADLSEIDVSARLTKSFELNVGEDTEKTEMPCEENRTPKVETEAEKAAVEQPEQANNNNASEVSKSKRERATRSQSLGATSSQQAVDKEIAENKRRCLSRRSVKLKAEEVKPELFEIEQPQPLQASNSEREEEKKPRIQSSTQSLPERPSIGRPLRKAAVKIQSYEELPVNRKMRRP